MKRRNRWRVRLQFILLTILVLMAGPVWFAGCGGYPGMLFRENMLKPTPWHKVENKPRPKEWPKDAVTATWIGHATVLINVRGVTILTDPVLGKRLGTPEVLGANLGIRRITEAAVRPENLPPIDIVLLSHAHHDHWDMASLKRFQPPAHAVIPTNTRDLLPKGHFGAVTELAWGERVRVNDVTITALPVEHWGRRGRNDIERGYNGYLIESGGTRVFFAGDSARIDEDQLRWRETLGGTGVDLVLLPIGESIYRRNHMSPEEAWELFRALGGRRLMPIHWRTFIMSPRNKEPTFAPLERLKEAAGEEAFRIVGEEPGEVVTVDK